MRYLLIFRGSFVTCLWFDDLDNFLSRDSFSFPLQRNADSRWEEIEMELSQTDLSLGGLFSLACKTEHRGVFYVYLRNIKQPNIQLSVAIIVPFRDRDTHLRIFLRHIHPFLMRQNILHRLEIWILFS